MREKFVLDFHECLSKSGIDEKTFIEVIKFLFREYEEKGVSERSSERLNEESEH